MLIRIGGAGGGGEWQLWETVPATETSATLQMLNPGSEYQFRVAAVNRAGKRSEAGHPSQPRAARAKNGKDRLWK